MSSYVVTGASRGIGLELVRQLSSDPKNTIFALVRNKAGSTDLQELAHTNGNQNVHIVEADISDYKTIKSAAEEVSKLSGGKLDVLINNAALMRHDRGTLTVDAYPDEETLEKDFELFFKTNVIGTTHTINAFLPLILAGSSKKVIVVSSSVGSLGFTLSSGFSVAVPYAASKAAVNMIVAKFAVRFRKEGLVFLAVNPGLVKTMPGTKEEVDAYYERINASIRATNPAVKGYSC